MRVQNLRLPMGAAALALALVCAAAACRSRSTTRVSTADPDDPSASRGARTAEASTPRLLGPAPAATRGARAIEQVAALDGAMPTGVAVSREGRVFTCFPRWGDELEHSVAEVVDGAAVAYPDERINRWDPERPGETFVCVQSVVVDARDRLWVLDPASPALAGVVPGGAKLVEIDLGGDRVVRTIAFPEAVVPRTSYLNDVRFDLRAGEGGFAYVTDSSPQGAIVVVDLASGESWRRLAGHSSTRAEPGFQPFVEGRAVRRSAEGRSSQPFAVGSDGIAISADGSRLWYCPLSSRRLYSVETEALRDRARSEDEVARTVRDEGEKPASDGLESDAEGRVYATAYELDAVLRRERDGSWTTLVHDPRVLWPDTLAVGADGHLYGIANQLHRQPSFQEGRDLRQRPYLLFRVANEGTPVRLR